MDRDHKPPRLEDIMAAALRDGIVLAVDRAPHVLDGAHFLHEAARRNERLIAENRGGTDP